MSAKLSFGKIEFEFRTASGAASTPRDPTAPFRIALLGDFSGRASRSIVEPIGTRRPRRIDCDNFAEVLTGAQTAVRLPAPWEPPEPIEVHLASIDDLHPDRILAQLKPLQTLVAKRRELLDPMTAAAAAAELESLLDLRPNSENAPDATSSSSAQTAPESHEETLARLLGKSPPAASTPPVAPSPSPHLQQLIRNVIAPVVVPTASPHQTAILAALDLELTHQLRAILHHPTWQGLEAAWRGVDLLVRQFGGDEAIELWLIDVSAEELTTDLLATETLSDTHIAKLLRTNAADAPWAVLIGHYTFRPTAGDIQVLGRLAKISASLGAPFLAGATPGFVGCDRLDSHPDPDDWNRPMTNEALECWQALRKLPEAACVGLALPRFLVRQPYGRRSDPISAFPFEELPVDPAHESFLWGNPAVLCGCILADAFLAEGWELPGAGSGEVGDLPVCQFSENGETQVKPCAEAWLGERAGDAILRQGLMPLLSIRGRDAVRLESLQSISEPPSPLHGRWG